MTTSDTFRNVTKLPEVEKPREVNWLRSWPSSTYTLRLGESRGVPNTEAQEVWLMVHLGCIWNLVNHQINLTEQLVSLPDFWTINIILDVNHGCDVIPPKLRIYIPPFQNSHQTEPIQPKSRGWKHLNNKGGLRRCWTTKNEPWNLADQEAAMTCCNGFESSVWGVKLWCGPWLTSLGEEKNTPQHEKTSPFFLQSWKLGPGRWVESPNLSFSTMIGEIHMLSFDVFRMKFCSFNMYSKARKLFHEFEEISRNLEGELHLKTYT